MQVILLERVPNLGSMGEVVKVKPGYARNFLIPTGRAQRATEEALANYERRRAQLEADNQKRKEEAQAVADKIDGLTLTMIRSASEGRQLYGSVSPRDVVEAVQAQGFAIERSQVRINEPIKELGLFDVTVAPHPEVEATVVVNVARTAEEAELQARGELVLSAAERDRLEEEEAAAEAAAARQEALADVDEEERPEE